MQNDDVDVNDIGIVNEYKGHREVDDNKNENKEMSEDDNNNRGMDEIGDVNDNLEMNMKSNQNDSGNLVGVLNVWIEVMT